MHTECPHCQSMVVQTRNREGPNFCPNCKNLFNAPEQRKLSPWILGVLTILVANLQMISQ
jgi:hypothetical protein